MSNDQNNAPSVQETFDRIADHFDETRQRPWPEVGQFLTTVEPGPVGLDLGCGNGRHAELLAPLVDETVGVDISTNILRTARDRATVRSFPLNLLQGDARAIPLRTDSVSIGLYIASLHHLRGREVRRGSLDDFARVLAPNGRGLISVWSTMHDRFDRTSGFDTTIDWTLPNGNSIPRYYHIFDPAEFTTELEESALPVIETFVSSGNCFAVVGGDSGKQKHP